MPAHLLTPNFIVHPQFSARPAKVSRKGRHAAVSPTPPTVSRTLHRAVLSPPVRTIHTTRQAKQKVLEEAVSAGPEVPEKSKPSKLIDLPQRVPGTAYTNRQTRIQRARTVYRWSHQHISHAALLDNVPERELPSRKWVVKVKRVENRCEKNKVDLSDLRKTVREPLSNINHTRSLQQPQGAGTEPVQETKARRSSTSTDIFQSYKDQFIQLERGTVTDANQFLRDDIFGWYRIAGPNPMQIRACKQSDLHHFPELTEKIFQTIDHFQKDTLLEAFEENRLFIVDYPELAEVSSAQYSSKQKPSQFTYAPTALFAVPKEQDLRSSILPVAIRCGRGDSFPLYYASEQFTDPVSWLAAKVTVQVADAIVHEVVYHFARTHLLLEVFVCAMNRSLSDEHPLYMLLDAHLEGTAFINNNSLRTLVSAGGIIDRLTASNIRDTQKMAADGLKGDFSFNGCMPDVELRGRGVLQQDTSLNYPYRDDALELWDCILDWSRSYVSEFYKDDHDVQDDHELGTWARELVKCGGLQGFGENGNGAIHTREYLSRVVAMVIFSGSVQHAAVNFPQSTMMNFSPAMPLCGYCAAPKEARPFGSVEELVDKMMPGLEYAETQMYAAELLGVVRHTTLGEYGKRLSFAGAGVQDALRMFKTRLARIGERIEGRNAAEKEAGLPEYNYLVPENIPQSTNI